MKMLLWGASGQLGHAIQEEFREHEVVPMTHRDGDITDVSLVRAHLTQHVPDVVINAAGYTDVDGAEAEPDRAYRVNALGPRNLALETGKLGITLLQVSTDYVFDGQRNQPYHEFLRPHPVSVYGESKLAGEEAVRQFNPHHYIVRTAWLFHTVGKNFLRTMCGLSTQPTVRVVNDQFGSPTYAPHLATALAQLIPSWAFGTYHLAGQGSASWYLLTQKLYQELGCSTVIQPVPRTEFPQRAVRPPYTVLTTQQDPIIHLPPWEEGVRAFVSHPQFDLKRA